MCTDHILLYAVLDYALSQLMPEPHEGKFLTMACGGSYTFLVSFVILDVGFTSNAHPCCQSVSCDVCSLLVTSWPVQHSDVSTIRVPRVDTQSQSETTFGVSILFVRRCECRDYRWQVFGRCGRRRACDSAGKVRANEYTVTYIRFPTSRLWFIWKKLNCEYSECLLAV